MNKRWIEAAGVRAVKTMAQTAIATIGTAAEPARELVKIQTTLNTMRSKRLTVLLLLNQVQVLQRQVPQVRQLRLHLRRRRIRI